MKRRSRILLALLAGLLLADQAVQWTVLRDGVFRERRVAPFDPPLFNDAQRRSLERVEAFARGEDALRSNVRFDPGLGWAPPPGFERGECAYDGFGTRIGSSGPWRQECPERRVVAVGCSFTHGDEVAGDETWASLLDERREDLRVANLGVGAYGADQILLRLRRDGLPLAPDDVLFGLLPGAALRVTDLYRPALRHHDASVGFKPRFVLEDGLRLLPCPAQDAQDIARLLTDQAAFCAAVARDFWVARWPAAYAPSGSHPAHWLACSRLLLTKWEGQDRDPAPWLLDASSEPCRLLRALLLAAARESEAAGARFTLVVLPDRRDLGARYWQRLLDDLQLAVLDVSDALVAAGAREDDSFWQPQGHYSPRANALVAEAIDDWLR